MSTEAPEVRIVQVLEWICKLKGHDFTMMVLTEMCGLLVIGWSGNTKRPIPRLQGELQTVLDSILTVSGVSDGAVLPLAVYLELIDELVGRGWVSDASTVCQIASRHKGNQSGHETESLALEAFAALLTIMTTGRFYQPLQELESVLDRSLRQYEADVVPRTPALAHVCVAYAYRLGFGYAQVFDIPVTCDRTPTGLYSRFLDLLWVDLMRPRTVTDDLVRLKFRVAGCALFLVDDPIKSPYYPHIKAMSDDISNPLYVKPLPGNKIRGYQTRRPEALMKHYRREGNELGRHAARLGSWTEIVTSKKQTTWHAKGRILARHAIEMLESFLHHGQPQLSMLASTTSPLLLRNGGMRQALCLLNRAVAHATGDFLHAIETDTRHFMAFVLQGTSTEALVVEGERLAQQLEGTDCALLRSTIAMGITVAYARLLPIETMALPFPKLGTNPVVYWSQQAFDMCPIVFPSESLQARRHLLQALQDELIDDSSHEEQLALVTEAVKEHSSQPRLRPTCLRIILDYIDWMAFLRSRRNYHGEHPAWAVGCALRLAQDVWSQMNNHSQQRDQELYHVLNCRARWYMGQSMNSPTTAEAQRRIGRYDGDQDPLWQATRNHLFSRDRPLQKADGRSPLTLHRFRVSSKTADIDFTAVHELTADQMEALQEEILEAQRSLSICTASDLRPQWRFYMLHLARLYESLWLYSSPDASNDSYAHAALALLCRLEEDLTDLRIELKGLIGGRGLRVRQRFSGQILHTLIYQKVINILLTQVWKSQREATTQSIPIGDGRTMVSSLEDLWQWVQKSKARTVTDLLPSSYSDAFGEAIVRDLDIKSQELWGKHVTLRCELQKNPALGVYARVRGAEAWRMHRRLLREWSETLQIMLDEEFGAPPSRGLLAGCKAYDCSTDNAGGDVGIVYVDWFDIFEDEYGMITLRSDRGCYLHSGGIGITESEISKWLNRFWHGSNHTTLEDSWPESPLQDLSRLVAPLKAMTRPGDVLVLSPTGLLHQLPLHALCLDGKPLIERNPIVYASSHTLAYKCIRAARRVIDEASVWCQSPTVISVYEEFSSGIKEPHFRPELQDHIRVSGQRQVDLLNSYRPPSAYCTYLYGNDATKVRVIEALQTSSFVSYLGHSEVPHGSTDNLDQHLRLYDGTLLPTSASKLTAEPLRAEDILDLRLPRSVVLLQACSSSEQSVGPGDEPLGLVTACLIAGATSVIGNLWPVDVGPASAFSAKLIKNLRDASAGGIELIDLARVFQATVLAFRQRYNATGSWASFVLHGCPIAPSWFRQQPDVEDR